MKPYSIISFLAFLFGFLPACGADPAIVLAENRSLTNDALIVFSTLFFLLKKGRIKNVP